MRLLQSLSRRRLTVPGEIVEHEGGVIGHSWALTNPYIHYRTSCKKSHFTFITTKCEV